MIALLPVDGLPEVGAGDDLAALVAAAVALEEGDVVVVAQKVVSKAEGAVVAVPAGADRAAVRAGLVRREAVRIVAEAPWTTIVETRHGFVCANAGVDASNVEAGWLTLLPRDPDASARRLRDGLTRRTGRRVAVVVTDTFGRPWREGQTDVAIGVAGLPVLRDERGGADRLGARLTVTEVAVADEVAAAADLVRQGKADGRAVVVVRGLAWEPDESTGAAHLVRPAATDLFARGRGRVADLLATGEAGALRVLGTHDRARAVAAARTAGAGRVRVDDGDPVVLAGDDHLALGAAAATLRAALLDLGGDGRVSGAPPRLEVTVLEPEPGAPGPR